MKTAELLAYIKRHIDLAPEEEALLLSKIQVRKYLRGQYVVQQGDVCKYESFVLSGCLKVFYLDNEGEQHVVMFAIEDWWVADLGSFIAQAPADYNVQCLEDSELVHFTPETLEQLYSEIPKLERFFRIIIQKAFVASQKRIVNNHCMTAKERYLRFRRDYPQIEQRVAQYLIASYLGITREFLSKIKAQIISE